PQSVLVCAGAAAMFALVVAGRAAHNTHSEPFPQTAGSWAGVLTLALICTVIGVTMFLAGLARIGPLRASTLSTFEPVMTAAVGVIALGERFAPIQLAGGILIILAAVLSARSQGRETVRPAGEAGATS